MCNSKIQKLDKKITLYRAFLDFFLPSTVKHPEEKRTQWAFAPVSRVIPNKKKESLKKVRPKEENADS